MKAENVVNYDLRYSDDGSSYSDATYTRNTVSTNSNGDDEVTTTTTDVDGIETDGEELIYLFDLDPVEAQYWRLVCERDDSDSDMRIYEVRLMEFAMAFENIKLFTFITTTFYNRF